MGRTGSNTVKKCKTRSIHVSNENRIICRTGSNHGSNGVEHGRKESNEVNSWVE